MIIFLLEYNLKQNLPELPIPSYETNKKVITLKQTFCHRVI